MWTATLESNPGRVLLSRLLKPVWPAAPFSSVSAFSVRNLPRQPLATTTWVRVRNRLAGVSPLDLQMISAERDFRTTPAAIPHYRRATLGQEVVGEVIEIGDHVQQLRVGDRVVFQYGFNCASAGVEPLCPNCASGNYALCSSGILPGPEPAPNGWSEEMLLHEQQLYRVPPSISDEQAVMFAPSAIALHAALRRIPHDGERILIIGAGTIGLLTLQMVRMLAPGAEVSVLARHSFQVELATRLGAAHIIYPRESYIDIQRYTYGSLYHGTLGNQVLLGGGYDVIYDTLGRRNTLHHALRWTRANASVVIIGHSPYMMNIDLTPLWYQELNLIGSYSYGMETWPTGKPRSTFHLIEEFITQGSIRPEMLITHRFALTDYQQALRTAIQKRQSRSVKVLFDSSLLPTLAVPNVHPTIRRQGYTATNGQALPTSEPQPLHLPETSQPSSSTPQWLMPEMPRPALTEEDTLTVKPRPSEQIQSEQPAPVEASTAGPNTEDVDQGQSLPDEEADKTIVIPPSSLILQPSDKSANATRQQGETTGEKGEEGVGESSSNNPNFPSTRKKGPRSK